LWLLLEVAGVSVLIHNFQSIISAELTHRSADPLPTGQLGNAAVPRGCKAGPSVKQTDRNLVEANRLVN
jgi:hypothetical protein